MRYITTINNQQYVVDINHEGHITLNGEVIHADMKPTLDPTFHSIIIDHRSHDVRINPEKQVYTVQIGGEIFEVSVEDERTKRLAGLKGGLGVDSGQVIIKAPMPGVIVDVPVTEGQEIAQGDVVIVLESMKMQNEFKAPRSGTVKAVRVAVGDPVEQNTVLLIIA